MSEDQRRPMTRERWQSLAPLVDAVLDRPPLQRLAYIAEVSAGNPDLASELSRFAAASDFNADSILEAAEQERLSLLGGRLFDQAIDLFRELQTALGDDYVIERELGGGGMSRLFVAEERRLQRKVVIKLLPAELTGARAERLANEIKLAASLQQANIVPVLSAGTVAGFPYYTMPFVEGRSLGDRFREGSASSITAAIGILRDVARALVFAHSRGVVHRDIKPGNILLSDRTAVVVDFGIAKAVAAAEEADDVRIHSSSDVTVSPASAALTSETVLIGTPAYMAPEQAMAGANVDHRADIYAFGCVAYELLTGTRAFPGATAYEIIAAKLHGAPKPVSLVRPEVPMAVSELVASCLERDPARRPQSAEQILNMLDVALSPSAVDAPKRSRRIALAVSTGALVTAGLAGWWYQDTRSRSSAPLTFAAVPFRNTSRDTSLDYRSDGIGDEILNAMSKVTGIQIVGRSTAFRYKDRTGTNAPDVRAIERGLGSRLLLTGTLRESDGRVTVSAQLNDSMSVGEIWSESFTGTRDELGGLSDAIARRLTDALRRQFGSRVGLPRRVVSALGTANPAALDIYLIGQAQLRRRDIGQSIKSFERAIAIDTNFARAHAALALALELDPFFNGTSGAFIVERALAEARRGLALDSTLADGWVALGNAYGLSARWSASDSAMRHAIALDPENAIVRQTFARQLIVRGLADEGFEQLERARRVESTSPLISAWLSYAFFLRGEPDSAIAQSDRTIQLDSTLLATTNLGSLVSLALGRTNVARRLVATTTTREMTNAPYVHARLGDTAEAQRLIREMEARNPRPWFVDVSRASVLLATGDSANALTALERSARESGPLWVFYMPLGDPAFDGVRRSPRFAALLRQANIDPKIITHPRRGS